MVFEVTNVYLETYLCREKLSVFYLFQIERKKKQTNYKQEVSGWV